jgi:hypothetical protein
MAVLNSAAFPRDKLIRSVRGRLPLNTTQITDSVNSALGFTTVKYRFLVSISISLNLLNIYMPKTVILTCVWTEANVLTLVPNLNLSFCPMLLLNIYYFIFLMPTELFSALSVPRLYNTSPLETKESPGGFSSWEYKDENGVCP